jgi:hypothetical protein
MEEVVERPLHRNLFRQVSHETRLTPSVPSDSEESDYENEHYERSLPRVVGVLIKKDCEVKTNGRSVTVQPEEVTTDGGTSQNENKNTSSSPKSETEKAVTIAAHGADQDYTQEEDIPATFHENDFQDDMDVSVVGQKTESPITTHQTEIEEFKQEGEKHDHQTLSVGKLTGKEIRASKVKNISH